MMKTYALLISLLSLAACAAPTTQTPVSTNAPIAGSVTDLAAFDQFIATRPTPEQFHARYPDVTLALPGSMNTKELRMNHSRYFAEVNADGRIIGGKFQ